MNQERPGSGSESAQEDLEPRDISFPGTKAVEEGEVQAGEVSSLAAEEQRDLEEDREALQIELLKLEHKQRQQDMNERKKYAFRVFLLLALWLALLFVLLFVQGWQSTTGFDLSDNVLIALITGTTVNVIGVFVVVMNYLFPKR